MILLSILVVIGVLTIIVLTLFAGAGVLTIIATCADWLVFVAVIHLIINCIIRRN